MKLHGMNCAVRATEISTCVDFEVLLAAMTSKERDHLRAMLRKYARFDRELKKGA